MADAYDTIGQVSPGGTKSPAPPYGSCASLIPTVAAPIVLLGGLVGVIVTYMFTVGTDTYARAFLWWSATLNLVGGLPHWVLPDSGLESIAKIELGEGKNPAKMFAIFMQGEEGQHRFFEFVIAYFVAFHQPLEVKYTWLLLALYCVQHLCNFLSATFLKNPNWSRGYVPRNDVPVETLEQPQASKAPGRFRFYVNFTINITPFIVRLCEAAAGRELQW